MGGNEKVMDAGLVLFQNVESVFVQQKIDLDDAHMMK